MFRLFLRTRALAGYDLSLSSPPVIRPRCMDFMCSTEALRDRGRIGGSGFRMGSAALDFGYEGSNSQFSVERLSVWCFRFKW